MRPRQRFARNTSAGSESDYDETTRRWMRHSVSPYKIVIGRKTLEKLRPLYLSKRGSAFPVNGRELIAP
jgi:hypothetical protein